MRGGSPKIVFLDDSEDLRELMPILLETRLGEPCSCFGSVDEMQRRPEEVLGAKVAILDINLGRDAPDGIEAFNWLRAHGFRGKVLFFTGHARDGLQAALTERSGVEILEKPLHPEKLLSVVSLALKETA